MADFIEEGIILSVRGNAAQVKITPKGTCPDSHVRCPVKALAEGREFITDADNSINAPAGQRVVIIDLCITNARIPTNCTRILTNKFR